MRSLKRTYKKKSLKKQPQYEWKFIHIEEEGIADLMLIDTANDDQIIVWWRMEGIQNYAWN